MGKLSNVPLADFRRFLKAQGLEEQGIKGGHEKWSKEGLLRPIIIQTHIDPIPEPIIKNNLRTMGVAAASLIKFLGR